MSSLLNPNSELGALAFMSPEESAEYENWLDEVAFLSDLRDLLPVEPDMPAWEACALEFGLPLLVQPEIPAWDDCIPAFHPLG